MGTSWFSADVDTGDVVAKTDIKDDGKVERYPYTVPDKISEGHGHQVYGTTEDFLKGNKPDWERAKDDPDSIKRRWKGNGYGLGINDLMSLSYSELQMIADASVESYVHSTFEIMSETLVLQQPKQLVLKK